MEALKLSGIPRHGKLVLDVPTQLNEQELEVIVLYKEQHNPNPKEVDSNDFLATLNMRNSIIGIAEYPDNIVSKYDVYEQ